MIEDWVDALCDVWAISDQRFGTVKSFRLIGESDFPDSIDPSDLDVHPIALTIPAVFEPEYSEGGPRIGFYSGVTEFHVAPDLNRSRVPGLMLWYGKILRAAAGSMKLGNLSAVEYFLVNRENGVQGPMALQYGNESPHWGFVVSWTVKEHISGLTVAR